MKKCEIYAKGISLIFSKPKECIKQKCKRLFYKEDVITECDYFVGQLQRLVPSQLLDDGEQT